MVRVIRILTLAVAVGPLLLRRPVGTMMGITLPLATWLLFALPAPLVLLALAWWPAAPRRLGRAFLPIILVLGSVNFILEKYITLAWLTPPASHQLNSLLLLVRLWFIFHVITLLVVWQYSLRWTVASAVILSLADGVLSLPFVPPDSPLFPLFVALFAARTVTVVGVALGVGWLLQRQRRQQQALAEANRKLAQFSATAERLAVTQERNRLAREMHDTLAHSLSAVAVQLEAVAALWDADPPGARALLEQAEESTRIGLREARRALKSLRASPLDEVGLPVAIANLARSTAARGGLKLDLAAPAHLDALPPEQEQCVYRVAAEALENVARHAQATRLRVALTRVDDAVTLTVADDGCGFDVAGVDDDQRFGLRGMRERVEMLGGALVITSQVGQGTTVQLTVRG